MPENTTLSRLARILVSDFSAEPDAITPQATFRGTLLMDSLDIVDLIFFVQREFGIAGATDDFCEVHSVADLIDVVEARAELAA